MPSSPRHGIVLFAHGARDPQWAQPFLQLQQQLLIRHDAGPVILSYLEFMSPDLRSAGQQMAAAGCDQVSIVPLFMGAGGHVRKELPQLVSALEKEIPAIRWRLLPPIGEQPQMLRALTEITLDMVHITP